MHALIATILLAAPQAPTIDYGGQAINPSHSAAHTLIGWSNDEGYFAWDTELNGGGAMSTAERTIVSTRMSRTKAYWNWDEGDGDPQPDWLNAVSTDTFSELGLPAGGPGHLIYQFQPSFFLANHRLKPFSQLKTQYTFVLQGTSHTVSLQQSWEPNWTAASPEPGEAGYRRARVIVRVDGNPIGRTEFNDVAGYSIDKIYLSPSRDCIAVSLARFTLVWFEGLNLLAERQVMIGRYR